jgi:hypothetical protein
VRGKKIQPIITSGSTCKKRSLVFVVFEERGKATYVENTSSVELLVESGVNSHEAEYILVIRESN